MSHREVQNESGGDCYVLGLLADPGVPARIGAWLEESDRLAERLTRGTGDRWRVELVSRRLRLDEDGQIPVIDVAREEMAEQEWDAAVLVTDLPRRAEGVPIMADYSTTARVGMLSVPGLGAVRTRRRALAAISHLVAEHINPGETTRQRSQHAEDGPESPGTGGPSDEESREARRLPRPLAHVASSDGAVDEHITLVGLRGRVRLMAGMVRANRPWTLVPSLSPAIAGAAAGAAFGVFYSNIWMLADALSVLRLLLVGALALFAMITWLIVDNGLWERRSDVGTREQAVIANTATVTTISVAVAYMYLLLFIVTLGSALVVIPGAEMGRNLGHTASFGDYASLAWLATSMGTIAGALGSGLADEEAVRQAAYSRREYQRRQRRESERGNEGAGE